MFQDHASMCHMRRKLKQCADCEFSTFDERLDAMTKHREDAHGEGMVVKTEPEPDPLLSAPPPKAIKMTKGPAAAAASNAAVSRRQPGMVNVEEDQVQKQKVRGPCVGAADKWSI